MLRFHKRIYILSVLLLAGCGATVPRIAEPWEKDFPGVPDAKPDAVMPITASGQIEYEVKKNIYCKLRAAVGQADQYFNKTKFKGKALKTRKILPDEWGAQVALSFQVDESSAFNPGVTLNTPLPTATSNFYGLSSVMTPQSSVVGLGGTLSSTASRTDKFNSYYDISYLRDPKVLGEVCKGAPDAFERINVQPARSSFLADELGINSWLLDAVFVDESIPSYGSPSSAATSGKTVGHSSKKAAKPSDKIENNQDAISIEIKFVIVTSGNVTPTWKLVRVSANTGSSPFFAAGRTRTHDLIITIGPKNTQTDYANLALQIGQAVSGGNRSSGTTQ